MPIAPCRQETRPFGVSPVSRPPREMEKHKNKLDGEFPFA